jgi:hypothetical protein
MARSFKPHKNLFQFPSGHPLEKRSDEFTDIHPHDHLSLTFHALNTTFLLTLEPNLDLVHSDVHNEASKGLGESHDLTILSQVRAYRGTVHRYAGNLDHSNLEKFHKVASTLEQNLSFRKAGEARLVILSSGEYRSPGANEHHFHEIEFQGSFSLSGEDFDIQTIPQFILYKRADDNQQVDDIVAPPHQRQPVHRRSKLMITKRNLDSTRKSAGCGFARDMTAKGTFWEQILKKRDLQQAQGQIRALGQNNVLGTVQPRPAGNVTASGNGQLGALNAMSCNLGKTATIAMKGDCTYGE